MNDTHELIKKLQLADKYSTNYLYSGYDIYFIHGWFYSYILALTDNPDDLWFPDYLIIDDSKITDEKLFIKFIDNLLLIYTNLTNNTFEKNYSICALIDVNGELNSEPLNMSELEQKHLFSWLFGYLNGWLVSWSDDIAECFTQHQDLEDKFYQATFYLCGAFIQLCDKFNPNFSDPVLENYTDLKLDILEMWEMDYKGILSEFAKLNDNLDIANLISGVNSALNNLFGIMRLIDERKINGSPKN